MSTVSLLSSAAAKRAVETLVSDVVAFLKERVGSGVQRLRTNAVLRGLHRRLRDIRHVKTVWQVEKAVDLALFYYPARLQAPGATAGRPVQDLADLGEAPRVAIRGTIGQGKSMLLRFLAAREMQKAKRIPIFLELRRARSADSLRDALGAELQSLGLPPPALKPLADGGRLALFLDGFDEVPEEEQTPLVSALEALAKEFVRVPVVVASRPNGAVLYSPQFPVFSLEPLKPGEHRDVIRHLVADAKVSEEILSRIDRRWPAVRELLTTPLLVTLLVIRYRADATLPENRMSFFESLFPVLLNRHDRTKSGYVRPRRSRLGDGTLERVFDALCFLTRKTGEGAFRRKDLCVLAAQAVEAVGASARGEDVLEDVIRITGLLVEDGAECVFLHKSIQEYHAASFVRSHSDEFGRTFYESVAPRWTLWQGELAVLEHLDPHRFLRYFAIPSLRRFLRLDDRTDREGWTPTRALIAEVFGRDAVDGGAYRFRRDAWPQCWMEDPGPAILPLLGTSENHAVVGERMERGVLPEAAWSAYGELLVRLHRRYEEARRRLDKSEAAKSLFDLS